MMTDPRLLNLLDYCALLDGQPTHATIDSVRQLVRFHLDGFSVNAAPLTPDDDALYALAWSTFERCNTMGRENESDWWAAEHARVLDYWRLDRITAERIAHGGRVSATTLLALGAAERGAERDAEPQTETAASDPMAAIDVSAVDYQTAFERGWGGIPSFEPGHLPLG